MLREGRFLWNAGIFLFQAQVMIDAFRARYDVTVELVETARENVEFKVPRVLREPG